MAGSDILLATPPPVSAGSREICRAEANIIVLDENRNRTTHKVECKLDSCGSVSLAHSKFLRDIKPCSEHSLDPVNLNGIGGRSGLIDKAGVLTLLHKDGETTKVLCYAFDKQ